VSSSLQASFVLDALEQAIRDRGGNVPTGLVHHQTGFYTTESGRRSSERRRENLLDVARIPGNVSD